MDEIAYFISLHSKHQQPVSSHFNLLGRNPLKASGGGGYKKTIVPASTASERKRMISGISAGSCASSSIGDFSASSNSKPDFKDFKDFQFRDEGSCEFIG